MTGNKFLKHFEIQYDEYSNIVHFYENYYFVSIFVFAKNTGLCLSMILFEKISPQSPNLSPHSHPLEKACLRT